MLLLTLAGSSVAFGQCEGRYADRVFDEIEIQTDVLFGSTIDPQGNPLDLYMDVYQPVGDELEARPLILLAFGGSFIGGSKDSPDIVALCDSLAHRGFVTAAISYSLEQQASLIQVDKMIKIIFRAVHDGKAAVRFFRKDAVQDNEYRIDTDRIYMGGSSAGAILATHLAYLSEEDDLQGQYLSALEDLGVGFEGDSGNLGYSSEVHGVISLAGALGLPEWMDEGEVPIVSMHSTGDNTVVYDVGPPLQALWLPDLYGSGPLHERADEVGIRNTLHTYESNAHPPYAGSDIYNVLQEHVDQMTTFLAPQLDCPMVGDTVEIVDTMNTAIMNIIDSKEIKVYPNPAYDYLAVEFVEIPVNAIELKLYDALGRLAIKETSFDRLTKINTAELAQGMYHLLIQNGDEVRSSKVLIK